MPLLAPQLRSLYPVHTDVLTDRHTDTQTHTHICTLPPDRNLWNNDFLQEVFLIIREIR